MIGDGGRLTSLKDALNASKCNNVDLLNPVRRDELINIYQSADILFLHLNDYDAFRKVLPYKLFEYAALGKPIWAGIAGYAAEFVTEHIENASVFAPCNVDAAVEALQRLEISMTPRAAFIDRFSRANIMRDMAADVISTSEVS